MRLKRKERYYPVDSVNKMIKEFLAKLFFSSMFFILNANKRDRDTTKDNISIQ